MVSVVRGAASCLAAVTLAAAGLAVVPAGPAAAAARPAVTTLPSAATPVPGSFRTMTPARLLDTRKSPRRPQPGGVLTVRVGGVGGVPAAGIDAALLHITVVNARRAGHLTAYPAGTPAPATSTVNVAAGRVVSNNALVGLGKGGAVALRLAATTDVVVDVLGWVVSATSPTAGSVVAIRPARLLDTRARGQRVLTRAGRTVTVAGVGGVPATAAAVVLNVTTVGALRSTPITVWPAGSAQPRTSNLNTQRGFAVAAQAVVGVGARRAVSVTMSGVGSVQLVIDVVGYIAGGSAGASGTVAMRPTRVLDTRAGHAPFAKGSSRTIALGGVLPADAAAAILTLTSVPGRGAGGYLVAFAHGAERPNISDLNPVRDLPVASQVIVPLGVDRSLTLSYVGGSGDVAVDLSGYVRAVALPAVQPTVLAGADLATLATGQGALAASVLNTASRYALHSWWPNTAPSLLAQVDGRAPLVANQDAIRRLSMEAFSLSAALATGGYDAGATGYPAADATEVVASIVASVACNSRANKVGGWGGTWQSAMWSSYAGRAAWFVWPALPAATQACVQRMVMWEADFVSRLSPGYMVAADGRVLSSGDTKAEEDSWYALAPALAVAMMPTAEQRDVWRLQEERLLIAAWARPGDVGSATLVDGVPLSRWLAGSNVLPNGVVLNHVRVAPDYATNGYQSVDAAVMAVLAGRPAPQATLTGLEPVYAAMSAVTYPAPPYGAPGGAVYPVDQDRVYYPQGCDWGTGQQLPYALFDADADVFGFGGSATVPAPVVATLHLTAAAAMQQRNADGAMYLPADRTEYTYVGREEHSAQLAAQVYLSYFVGSRLDVQVSPQPVTPSGPVVHGQLQVAPPAQNERVLQR